MARLGPLLQNLLERIDRGGAEARARERSVVAAHVGGTDDVERLPLVVQFRRSRPRRGETWPEFRARLDKVFEPLCQAGPTEEPRPLYLANALACSFARGEIAALAERRDIETVELDPIVNPTQMDDAIEDIGLAEFQRHNGPLTGDGVRVAVLDSGIDVEHPFLRVTESISTCDEDVAIPGRHGTHCAGILASRDTVFPGVAPGVALLNVKVLRHDGTGRHTDVTKGVDAALDLEADILSISLGFNHLPAWSDGGHGWHCPEGRCPLCTAVDNAVAFGAIVCAAAGNEHGRAEALRRFGHGASFDTELGCPGQARGAITVGALTKRTFLPAEFTSRGPAAYGAAKPDLAGPGVNMMSTIPVPRLPTGKPVADPQRAALFGSESGTSAATPVVAGAAALLLQARRKRRAGTAASAASAVRKALLEQAVTRMAWPANVVGAGRIDLGRFGTEG